MSPEKLVAERGAQGLDDVLLPQEAVAAAGAEVGEAHLGTARSCSILSQRRVLARA